MQATIRYHASIDIAAILARTSYMHRGTCPLADDLIRSFAGRR